MGGQLNNAAQRRACLAGDLNGLPQMITVIMRHQNNIRPGNAPPVRSERITFKKGINQDAHTPRKNLHIGMAVP